MSIKIKIMLLKETAIFFSIKKYNFFYFHTCIQVLFIKFYIHTLIHTFLHVSPTH